MDQLIAWIKAFISWFSSPFKTMIALVFLTGIALFLPINRQSAMGISDWTGQHRVVEWSVFLFCSIFLVLSLAENIGTRVIVKRRLKHRLNNLAGDEKKLLSRFVDHDWTTLIAWPHEGGIGSLEMDGTIVRTESTLTNGQHVYSISQHI